MRKGIAEAEAVLVSASAFNASCVVSDSETRPRNFAFIQSLPFLTETCGAQRLLAPFKKEGGFSP